MRYLQYRFYDKRGEAPAQWYNNGLGIPSRDDAIRKLLEPSGTTSLKVSYEDGSAIEFRFEPKTS